MNEGEKVAKRAKQALDPALERAAQLLANRIRANLPVGDPSLDPSPETSMRNSIEIDRVTDSRYGDRVRVTVNTPYAARQNFDLGLKHPRGGSARFMTRALHESVGALNDVVAHGVRVKMHGKVR